MRSSASGLLVGIVVAACSQDPTPAASPCPTDLRWEREIEGVVLNWCTPCHAAPVTGDARHGAPVGVDFDTLEGVRLWSDRILARATTDPPTMPPAGGTTDEERSQLFEWLTCGAPGEDAPPPPLPCATPVAVATDRLETGADVDSLCAAGDVLLTGGLTLERAGGVLEVDCLCGIAGDLTISGGARVSMPQLVVVGGAVRVEANPTLTALELPALETVGGDLLVTDAGALGLVELSNLVSIAGRLHAAEAPALDRLWLRRLVTVGGEVRLEALPALTSLYDFESLTTVGGDLVVRDTGLLGMHDLRVLTDVTGDIRFEDNRAMERMDGMWWLASARRLHVSGSPLLTTLLLEGDVSVGAGATNLYVPTVWTLEELALIDVPALETLAIPSLEEVGALRLEGTALSDLSGVAALAAMTEVPGDLVISGTRFTAVDGLGALTSIGGDLVLTSNLSLDDIAALQKLEAVGGDLVVVGNPSLAAADASALAGSIASIGGEVIVSDNGP